MSKVNKVLEDTLRNIEEDRKAAKDILKDVGAYIGQSPDRYATAGTTLTKALESLQRSNEQRIKVLGILVKNTEDTTFGEVTNDEATEIYEQFEKEDLEND